MLALIGSAISVLATLLPELIALIKSFQTSPAQEVQNGLKDVKAAMRLAASKAGNTKPIEDIINK